jgi:prepilin-type N-terminal cleavage/methylation domain-containing protein/prepilin-type processing-associated H-X9-DG protein
MVIRRRRGFTLIELLVVIAIIAILAAMLFPVFARARESARKIQCLSNVKNIAMALQMYMNDYGGSATIFPREVSAGACAYFDSGPGGDYSEWWDGLAHCKNGTYANPYLRAAVMLDEYIRNRDVWRCPSARFDKSAEVIIPMGPNGHWWEHWQQYESVWTADGGLGPCQEAFPTGWGGSVTDSLAQQKTAGVTGGEKAQGAYITSLGYNGELYLTKPAEIDNPTQWVGVADFGIYYHFWDFAIGVAYDLCRTTSCQACQVTSGEGEAGSGACCIPSWSNCPWSVNCSADPVKFFEDPQYRKQFARHMGGVNLGFMDGHAAWVASEALISGSNCNMNPNPYFQGTSACWWPACR